MLDIHRKAVETNQAKATARRQIVLRFAIDLPNRFTQAELEHKLHSTAGVAAFKAAGIASIPNSRRYLSEWVAKGLLASFKSPGERFLRYSWVADPPQEPSHNLVLSDPLGDVEFVVMAWEYDMIPIQTDIEVLNKLGAKGWEVTHVMMGAWILLKRPTGNAVTETDDDGI